MLKKGPPNSQLKFMHEINDEHTREIEVRPKAFNESILHSKGGGLGNECGLVAIQMATNPVTLVGTDDVGLSNLSTAAPPMGNPRV
jgi:hypothetical protein